jgi:hypothetical protein
MIRDRKVRRTTGRPLDREERPDIASGMMHPTVGKIQQSQGTRLRSSGI